MRTPYAFAVELPQALPAAIDTLRAALTAEQMGIVSEVDVQATLKAKLGLDSHPQKLLGICSPKIAHALMGAEPDIATVLLEAVVQAGDQMGAPMAVMGQHHARYVAVAEQWGLTTVAEGFAYRGYAEHGRLIPRDEPRAVLTDEVHVIRQVVGLARGTVTTIDGTMISVRAESVCVHSDTPGAARLAGRIRRHLARTGVEVRAWP